MPTGMLVTRPVDVSQHHARAGVCVRAQVCVCLTIRKHLDTFLLLVVVARGGALVTGELWAL